MFDDQMMRELADPVTAKTELQDALKIIGYWRKSRSPDNYYSVEGCIKRALEKIEDDVVSKQTPTAVYTKMYSAINCLDMAMRLGDVSSYPEGVLDIIKEHFSLKSVGVKPNIIPDDEVLEDIFKLRVIYKGLIDNDCGLLIVNILHAVSEYYHIPYERFYTEIIDYVDTGIKFCELKKTDDEKPSTPNENNYKPKNSEYMEVEIQATDDREKEEEIDKGISIVELFDKVIETIEKYMNPSYEFDFQKFLSYIENKKILLNDSNGAYRVKALQQLKKINKYVGYYRIKDIGRSPYSAEKYTTIYTKCVERYMEVYPGYSKDELDKEAIGAYTTREAISCMRTLLHHPTTTTLDFMIPEFVYNFVAKETDSPLTEEEITEVIGWADNLPHKYYKYIDKFLKKITV